MRRWLRNLLIAVVAVPALLIGAGLASPWPGATAIRLLFERGAAQAAAGMARHAPPGIEARHDIPYDAADPAARLDLYRPAGAAGALPVVVWVHGGAFIAGGRRDVEPYLRILAGRGFAGVAVGYSLAPAATYPTPIRQVNAALGFLRREAASLGLDPDRIVLAGDSAGAQIAAQIAALATGPDYARAVGIEPTLPPESLRGVLLFCGPYDVTQVRLDGPFGIFLRIVLWSYSGRRDFMEDPEFLRMSVTPHVTASFPPAFISVGNADPLAPHSEELARALVAKGVSVETLFFRPDHEPPLGHEYQFDLDGADGRRALERAVDFLQRRLGG